MKEREALLPKERIEKVISSCRLALEKLEQGNLRLALGDLDFASDKLVAAKMIIINEIIEADGKL